MKCIIAKSDICSTNIFRLDGLVKMESYMDDFASKFDGVILDRKWS